MKIGIDIDGVLTDIEQWQIDYGSKYFSDIGKRVKNKNGYEVSDIFDVSADMDSQFWGKYLYEYATSEPARKFASEVIRKLKENGNEIYIITARYKAYEDSVEGNKMKDIVINWLKDQDIYYDEIFFTPENKLDVCLENKIDVMIEDSVHNIETLSKRISVICFDAGYNKNCNNENITRVYSWYDIYNVLREVKND